MRKPPLAPLMTLAWAVYAFAGGDSLNYYFLYQRTAYLENTLMPGSWWANPASLGEIGRKTLQTVNTTPLGNVLTIASAKYLTPVSPQFDAGVGIMGQGINPADPSFQASNAGAQYQSQFSFVNPSAQFAGSMKLGRGGLIGLLLNIGAEQLPASTEVGPNFANYLTMGFGAGYLSPWFFDCVSLGLSVMTTGHFWLQTYWDNDGKLALRYRDPDSLFTGSLECTFSLLGQGLVWIGHSPAGYYEVVKAMVSVRFMQIAGLLLGYSDDIQNLVANGPCAHVGLELRQSNVYRYYGGYEIGIGLGQLHRDLLVHRLWVGYDF